MCIWVGLGELRIESFQFSKTRLKETWDCVPRTRAQRKESEAAAKATDVTQPMDEHLLRLESHFY